LTDDVSETEIYQVQELLEDYETPNKKVGEREVTTVKNLKSITSVIKDFEFFAAEKWKIASDKQGSGNTANIGSTLSIEDLRNENGIFSQLGEEWFDEYWINFGSATMVKDGKTVKITSLRNFLEFKGRNDLWDKIVSKTSKNYTK
jgi:membrane-bound ClpP family serine protease